MGFFLLLLCNQANWTWNFPYLFDEINKMFKVAIQISNYAWFTPGNTGFLKTRQIKSFPTM